MEGNDDFGDAFPEAERVMYGITNAIFDADFVAADAAAATATVESPGASFARVARALSEYVRNTIQNNRDSTGNGEEEKTLSFNNGKAWRQETYIKVRWAFLTLPLLVLVATLALLAAAVRGSMGKGAKIWKSSSLALLFHEVCLGEKTATSSMSANSPGNVSISTKSVDWKTRSVMLMKQQLGIGRQWRFDKESVHNMNEEADKMKARLVEDGDGFRFIVEQ